MTDKVITAATDGAEKPAAAKDVVILKNVSARLYIIGAEKLVPTQAKAFPKDVLKLPGVQIGIDDDELAEADEECDPIIDEKEAEKEAAARKKAEQGNKRNKR